MEREDIRWPRHKIVSLRYRQPYMSMAYFVLKLSRPYLDSRYRIFSRHVALDRPLFPFREHRLERWGRDFVRKRPLLGLCGHFCRHFTG